MMNLFYCPDISDSTGHLSPDESAHCIKVLRHRKGDFIQVTDGKGSVCEARIVSDNPRSCTFQITRRNPFDFPHPCTIHIAIAPTKNMERFEWFLEKSVELGTDTITPLICRRSERKTVNRDRLHKLIISSVKQSFVPFMPVMNDPEDFNTFLEGTARTSAMKYIGHCGNTERLWIRDTYVRGSDTILLIGPEGDFTPEEIEMAVRYDFIPVKLSDSRLRTETAGVVACHTIHLLNGG